MATPLRVGKTPLPTKEEKRSSPMVERSPSIRLLPQIPEVNSGSNTPEGRHRVIRPIIDVLTIRKSSFGMPKLAGGNSVSGEQLIPGFQNSSSIRLSPRNLHNGGSGFDSPRLTNASRGNPLGRQENSLFTNKFKDEIRKKTSGIAGLDSPSSQLPIHKPSNSSSNLFKQIFKPHAPSKKQEEARFSPKSRALSPSTCTTIPKLSSSTNTSPDGVENSNSDSPSNSPQKPKTQSKQSLSIFKGLRDFENASRLPSLTR